MTFLPSSGKSFILGRVDEAVSNELGLGELAGLTVANEAESLAYDVSEEYVYTSSHLRRRRCRSVQFNFIYVTSKHFKDSVQFVLIQLESSSIDSRFSPIHTEPINKVSQLRKPADCTETSL